MLNSAYCIIVAQCPLSYGLTPYKQEILSDYVLQNHDHIYTLQHYIHRTYIDPKTRAALLTGYMLIGFGGGHLSLVGST